MNAPQNYLIQYTCYSTTGAVLKEGKMRVKQKFSSFEAQCSFEKYLQKQFANFGKLVVNSCQVENPLTKMMNDFMGKHNNPYDIFDHF